MSVPTFSNGFVPLAILTASILGSAHCVAMCSGLVLAVAPSKRAQVFYHLGRGVGYVFLGCLAGYLGSKIFLSNSFGFLSWLGAAFLSLALISIGLKQYFKSSAHLRFPRVLSSVYERLWRVALSYRESSHGLFVLGWMSSFMPCGWLYSFVLGAAALGSPLLGGAALLVFWVGTLPALSLGPLLVHKYLANLKGASPRFSGILLILAGFVTIGLRTSPLMHWPAHENHNQQVIKNNPADASQNCILHSH